MVIKAAAEKKKNFFCARVANESELRDNPFFRLVVETRRAKKGLVDLAFACTIFCRSPRMHFHVEFFARETIHGGKKVKNFNPPSWTDFL